MTLLNKAKELIALVPREGEYVNAPIAAQYARAVVELAEALRRLEDRASDFYLEEFTPHRDASGHLQFDHDPDGCYQCELEDELGNARAALKRLEEK